MPSRAASEPYDVVVVGSGLAGLTGANRLAQAGHRVCIVEQHFQLGGLATWFRRPGGELFDISLHGFPAGMKKTCRKYWSREIADAIFQIKGIRFHNPQFQLTTTFDEADFRRHMRDTFGVPDTDVERFFKRIHDTEFYDRDDSTVGEFFEEMFPGRNDVHRFLMEPIAYANGSTLDDPWVTYAIVFGNFMSKGVFSFNYGTDWMIKQMRGVLRDNGVDVKRNALVKRVVFENGVVAGVETSRMRDGVELDPDKREFIPCRAVLSNANVVTTVEEFAGEEAVPADFLAEAKAVRMNTASSQIYIGIKPDAEIPRIGDLFFTSKHPTFDSNALVAKDTSSWTFSFYYPEHRQLHNRCAIVASINSRWEDWAPLPEEQYQADKEKLIADTLDWLENWIPDIREKTSHVEASTPRTFHHYARVRHGSSFGTKFEGLAVSQRLPEVCPGLFHASSVGIIMSGWLGTANYGVIVASKIDAYLARLRSGSATARARG